MLRQRNSTIKKVKHLDVFSKVPEDYVRQSAIGGTFSVITFCMIIYLIYGETRYFFDSKLKFHFEPDLDIDAKLKINIDITVAMPCIRVGADFIDSMHDTVRDYDRLNEESTWWELSQSQRAHFETLKHMNSYFSEEYHAIHELLWKSNKAAYMEELPERESMPKYPPNACRIHGSVYVNKVVGNFHIVCGKALDFPLNHVHMAAFMTVQDYNFTHRINKFSFGDAAPGVIHPLEGDEKVADSHMMSYQYFIDVVQTDIDLLLRKSKTYQYSVKNYAREIDHNKASHGIPGIFFQYDMSSLKVTVTQQRDSVIQFFIKLCATVGGIYVTNGIISFAFQSLIEFMKNQYHKSENKETNILQSSNAELLTNLVDVPPPINPANEKL